MLPLQPLAFAITFPDSYASAQVATAAEDVSLSVGLGSGIQISLAPDGAMVLLDLAAPCTAAAIPAAGLMESVVQRLLPRLSGSGMPACVASSILLQVGTWPWGVGFIGT